MSLAIGGSFATANTNTTLTLTQQADGRTWTNAASAYLLPPSSQPATISVNITVPGGTKSYTYSTADELEAGYKINIEGTYTEAVGVALTGTLTGAAWKGEQEVDLTVKEFDLMDLLMHNSGKVFSREMLLNMVWGADYVGEVRTVDVHIRRLREKLERNHANPEHIFTKWGVGYYFRE